MRRREFVTLIGGAAAWPCVARAQQPAMPVIGFVSNFTANPNYIAAFRRGLGEVGYVEGHDAKIEYRWEQGGQYNRLPAVMADLIGRRVAVIVASPIPAALAAKAATSTVPVVFAVGSDPVEAGLVTSLNRPGGNITGVGFNAVALNAKRLDLLSALLPKATSAALLVNPNNANAKPQINEITTAAKRLGLRIQVWHASSEDDFEKVFANQGERRPDALVVSADPFFISHRKRLVSVAAHFALPTIYYARDFVVAGGLMSYGTDFSDAFRQAGDYAGQILKGKKPGLLPIILSDKFEFVINLKTAKALGLAVPPTLQAIADDVIE